MNKIIFLFLIAFLASCSAKKTQDTQTPEIDSAQEFSLPQSDNVLTEIAGDVIAQSFLREISVTSPRMNGPDIQILQERLLELGFASVGEADGFYGPMTAGEIYFIKAALGLMEYIAFGSDEEEAYYAEMDPRPADYQAVNKEIWDIIFDPEYAALLSNISLIRLFDSEPHVWEPERNPRVTEFKETQLPYTEPDWLPPWGLGVGSKVQKEYNYNPGTYRISVIETVESGWEYVTTDRDFTFQNGMKIRQTTYLESSPFITVSFSLP